jgi:hypothetical protein
VNGIKNWPKKCSTPTTPCLLQAPKKWGKFAFINLSFKSPCSVTYQPNVSSWVNPSHLLYFNFVGRIIGKAIYDGRLLDCYFTRSVYKVHYWCYLLFELIFRIINMIAHDG